MNIHDLRAAQARYENRIDEVKEAREEIHRLRSSFVRHFTRSRIRRMRIDDFVIGVPIPKGSYNFCYGLERQLDGLGRIIGATAFKFGVYHGRTKSDPTHEYRFTNKFGNNYHEAFENIRAALLQLLDLGASEDIDGIVLNPISAMFKGKILSTYFPDRYLNVFSWVHLNYFLTQLDLDTEELIKGDAVVKREALLKFKNRDRIMKKWSADLFADFIYTEYPGRPPKRDASFDNDDDPLSDYRSPDFPENPKPEFVDLKILPPAPKASIERSDTTTTKKTDYEKEARKLRRLGDRGEKIVLDMEKKRLRKAGEVELAKKVRRVSLESDSYGYDILSFDEDGTERLIEVKASRSKVGNANFFFTANELRTALKKDNYFIYMVYDIISRKPKVWAIQNPFEPENENVLRTPISYRVTINAEE